MNKETHLNTKNGAVDMTELAIAVVTLGIVVSIGAVVLHGISKASVTSLGTYLVRNESVASLNQAGDNLAVTWVKSVDLAINGSTGTVITSGNYTSTVNSDSGLGTLYATSTSTFNNSDWNVSYTVYNVSDPRYDLANDAVIGLSEYGNWFKILVIVGIAAVVLALIFMSFGKGSGADSDGGQTY